MKRELTHHIYNLYTARLQELQFAIDVLATEQSAYDHEGALLARMEQLRQEQEALFRVTQSTDTE